MSIAYTADKIFTGNEWLSGHSIIVNDGIIEDILPTSSVESAIAQTNFGQHFIAPAFIDIQIYGAGGKLFAMYPTTDALARLYDYCYEGGAHYFLPTVATNEYDVFYKCIDAIRVYWSEGGKGVLGLHVEGPWINEVKRGAHIKELIHAPSLKQATALLEYGKDVIKIITLAPEVSSRDVIDLVRSFGVIVSAGHSNATFAEATAAFDNSIPMATHLYNAMSPLQHRQPGMVGAVMHHKSAMASVIPDGHHVDFEAIAIAKKVMGERLFMITDAVTETANGPYPHQKEGDKYVSNGILSGSALTIIKGVKNCVDKIGISLNEALRMASLYPAKVLGMNNQLGKIAKDYKAEMVVLDEHLSIVEQVTAT
jgi:N-acetylglucosamine-6-phosphate deacetylase